MKKTLAMVMTLAMVLGLATGVMAAKPEPIPQVHTAEVTLDASATTVYADDEVSLTATTRKQGSDYTDSWTEAEKVATEKVEVNGETYYVSTANFDTSAAGTYDVTYSIIMTSGGSDTTFVGSKTITITVLPRTPRTVVSFELADWYFRNQGNTQGNNPSQDDNYQLVVTALNVEYSNGTTGKVEFEEGDELIVGGFSVGAVAGTDRRFDLSYGGATEQFTLTAPWEPINN